MKRSGYDGLLPAGMVVTGGGSQLVGLREAAREVSQRPVRMARPGNLRGLVDALNSPAYATAVGLLHWGMQGVIARPSKRRKVSGFNLKGWFGNLLP